MKLFIIAILVIIPIFIIPGFAQTPSDTLILVETILRDSNEHLITKLEITKISYIDQVMLEDFLDKESSPNDPIRIIEGQKMQIIERAIILDFNSNDVITNLRFSTYLDDEQIILLVGLVHDGFPVTNGDKLTQIWTFIRPL